MPCYTVSEEKDIIFTMRIKNFKRTIKYLVFSILLCAVLFISFGRTVYANEYIRYQSMDSEALAEWIKYKNEHEENNYTTVYVPQSESKNDSKNKSNATLYRIFPILYILVKKFFTSINFNLSLRYSITSFLR